MRYHGLDFLRAIMMSLGVVIHAFVTYLTDPLDGKWILSDESTMVADAICAFIHVFRMPIFFVMAGFFTALLVGRRGISGMFSNRSKRVLLPFVVFWVILVPATLITAAFADLSKADIVSFEAIRLWINAEYTAHPAPTTIHLWFLYLLLYFYAAVGILFWFRGPLSKLNPLFRKTFSSRWSPVYLAGLSTLTLIPVEEATFRTALSFVPDPLVLLGYSTFFFLGYCVYLNKDLLSRFERDWKSNVVLGFVFSLAYLWFALQYRFGPAELKSIIFVCTIATISLAVWFFCFGFTGFSLVFFAKERPWARYLADASYWTYLSHLPIVVVCQGLLMQVSIHPFFKGCLVIAVSSVVILLSYHYLVRSTFIGHFLNGRRYPRLNPLAVRQPLELQNS